MKKIGKTWENQYIWPNPKLEIFKACVMPLTNYGSEVIKCGHRTNTEFIRLLCNIMTYEEKSNLQAIHFTKRCLELEAHRLPKIISSRLVEIAEQEKTTQNRVKKKQGENQKREPKRLKRKQRGKGHQNH